MDRSHKTPALRRVQMDEASNVRVYLSGYADGEGCFCVSFNRSKRHKFGWEIRPSFSVSQNGDRSEVLEIYQRLFECGTIRPDRSDRTFKFETRSVSDLVTKVVPHFVWYPLRLGKQKGFERIAVIVELLLSVTFLVSEG